jgi:hypothetical protein
MHDNGRRPMKFRFLMSAMLAAAFCAAPTSAAWHGSANQHEAVPDTTTPKPAIYDITLTILESTSSSSGPCTGGEGYADVCVSGDCTCYTYTGKAIGAAGSGSVTFYESFDNDFGYVGYEAGCDVAVGEIDISGSKDVETLSFQGADCGSAFTSQGFLSGGCVLEDTSVFTNGAVGACTGKYSTTANTKFKITGTSEK